MIVGVTGRIASGKGVLTDFLESKGFTYISLSKVLRAIADHRGIAHTRENLQNLGNLLRTEEGNEALAKYSLKFIKEGNFIIDGIRNPHEVKCFRENLKDFKLVSFDAPQNVRFERMLERGKESDPRNWDEFLKIDKRDFGIGENDSGQGVGKCMELADFKLINDSSLGEIQREVEGLYGKLSSLNEVSSSSSLEVPSSSSVPSSSLEVPSSDGIKVKIKKLHPDAVIPKYAKEGDAGMDVHAISRMVYDDFIEYGSGLAFEIPKDHVCLIFPRSSVSNKKLSLSNSVGVLDSGYRGELKFRFYKHGSYEYGVGDRVGQIMIIPFPRVVVEEVESLGESERGEGGFGSSGK